VKWRYIPSLGMVGAKKQRKVKFVDAAAESSPHRTVHTEYCFARWPLHQDATATDTCDGARWSLASQLPRQDLRGRRKNHPPIALRAPHMQPVGG
jgi:hypothetical protein